MNLAKKRSMDKRVKAKWLAALRSGEYPQGKDALKMKGRRGEARFCCLGVLCDIAPPRVGRWDGGSFCSPEGSQGFNVSSSILTDKVRAWAGLAIDDPAVIYKGQQRLLSGLNDAGVRFETIARLIEEQL